MTELWSGRGGCVDSRLTPWCHGWVPSTPEESCIHVPAVLGKTPHLISELQGHCVLSVG